MNVKSAQYEIIRIQIKAVNFEQYLNPLELMFEFVISIPHQILILYFNLMLIRKLDMRFLY